MRHVLTSALRHRHELRVILARTTEAVLAALLGSDVTDPSPALASALRHRQTIRRVLDRLDERDRNGVSVLADLARRGRHRPGRDGYPSGGDGVGGGTDVARPTEGALLASYRVDPKTGRGWWVQVPDPTGRAIAGIFAALAEATGAMVGAEGRRVAYALAEAAGHLARVEELLGVIRSPGRQSSLQGSCEACGRIVSGSNSDRLRSGYCDACRKAWERAGFPDRLAFERERLVGLDERRRA